MTLVYQLKVIILSYILNQKSHKPPLTEIWSNKMGKQDFFKTTFDW